MALPVLQSGFSLTVTNGVASSITLTAATGIAVGDLLLLVVMDDADNESFSLFEAPAGYSSLIAVGSNNDTHTEVFYKTAEAADIDADVTVNHSSTNDELMGWQLRVSGASTGAQPDAEGTSTVGAGSTVTIPAITTNTADSLAFYVQSFDGGDGFPYSVAGTGWTQRGEGQEQIDGNTVSGSFGTKPMVSIGSTLDAVVTASVSDGYAGVQFAIAPAPASVTVTVNNASESDSAQAITRSKKYTIGTATETDSASNVLIPIKVVVGTATETSTAQAVTRTKIYPIGAGEDSNGQETDVAGVITTKKLYSIGNAAESDQANAITIFSQIIVVVGGASESSNAGSITAVKNYAIGGTTESNVAGAITTQKNYTIGNAAETDTANAVTIETPVVAETDGYFLPDSRLEMPALFYPRRKPVGRLKVNWSNSLTDGLIGCWIFNSGRIENMVNGRFGSLVGGCVIKNNDLNITDAGGNKYGTSPLGFAGSKFTAITSFKWKGSATASDNKGAVLDKSIGNNTDFKIIVSEDGGNQIFRFRTPDTSNANIDYVFSGVPESKTYVMAGRYDQINKDLFLDNVIVTTAAATETLDDSGDDIAFGYDQTFIGATEINLEYVFIYSKPLSDRSMTSLYNNPYQIFEPE